MINTIRNTIQSTIQNTLGDLSEKFITQLFVPVGSDSFITADNKIFKVRVDMSTLLYLFAEDQRGVWYDPSDLATMFQESTGTTAVTADGQPVGLVLDKSKGVIKTKTDTNITWDSLPSAVSQDGNVLTFTNVTSGFLIQVAEFYDLGDLAYCRITGTSNSSSSSFRVYAGSNFVQATESPTGTTIDSLAVATDKALKIFVFAGFEGTITIDEVYRVQGTHASQPVATKRPTYKETPDRLEIDLVDDALLFDVPTGGIDGYMVIGTNDGTASYGVSLPAGSYELGGYFFPSNTINGFLLREGAVSQVDLSKVESDFVSKGAKASYGDVTNFTRYWRNKGITEFPLIDTSSGTNFMLAWNGNNLTSFPLIDTSKGTTFSYAWRLNNLTSFPLIDTSSGTNFFAAWYGNNLTDFPLIDTTNGTNFQDAWNGNSTLADFPANMFDNCPCANFTSAFASTGLTQTSIDGILVSINSNGTSNGTFNQSGGSAPSVTGQTAIDAMRSRGWTITVTGGY